MTATSTELIAASTDPDLKARLVAILAATGHLSPDAAVIPRMGHLVAVEVTAGSSIAGLVADEVDVTDAHLVTALRAAGLIPEGV